MIRKALLSLSVLATCASGLLAAAPVQQRLTGVVSVTFPAAPRTTRTADQQNYLYETDTCAYLAQVKPYEADGRVHDSITLASFYDGMAKGILRAAKGTETHRSEMRVAGLRALDIEYIKGDSRSVPTTVHSRAAIVNGYVVVVSFTAPSELYGRMAARCDRFLGSITFAPDSVLRQYEPTDTSADGLRFINGASTGMLNMAEKGAEMVEQHNAAAKPPVPFMESHAGSVIKMFGLLIMVCALIYGWAVYTRRKG